MRFTILVALLPALCFADFNESCPSFPVSVPAMDSCFELSGNLLYLRPSSGNLGQGAVTDFLPCVSPEYHSAFNAGICYVLPQSGVDLKLDWIHLSSHDSKSVPTGVGALTRAKASVKFQYDVVNLDAGIFVDVGGAMRMRIFCGLSGVRIREALKSTFKNPSALLKISLDHTSSYTGIGPRFGFDCSYRICHGFNFVGQLGTGLLFGTMKPAKCRFNGSSEALELIGITVNEEQVGSDTVSQVVPSVDAQLGLSYAYEFCGGYILSIEAGYMGAFYVHPLRGYRSDFSVHGPYAELGLEF
jgi:hypothetical protein